MKKLYTALFLMSLFLTQLVHASIDLPSHRGSFKVKLPDNKSIQVYSYVPADATVNTPIVFVMTGVHRNAKDYRDDWIESAEQHHFIVLTPEFSQQQYPESNGYNLGNLINPETKTVNPPEQWSFSVLEQILSSLQQQKITQQSSYYLFGHSAGCQFVHRMLTFVPQPHIKAAVCTAAGWWTLPDQQQQWPYGLANAPVEVQVQQLKHFFALPLYIAVGENDNDPQHPLLRRTKQAMQQGPQRLARAHNYFMHSQAAAQALHTPFQWKFAVLPHVAHSGSKMSIWAATQFANYEKYGHFLE